MFVCVCVKFRKVMFGIIAREMKKMSENGPLSSGYSSTDGATQTTGDSFLIISLLFFERCSH